MEDELEQFKVEVEKWGQLQGEEREKQLDKLLSFPSNKAWLESDEGKKVKEDAEREDDVRGVVLWQSPLHRQYLKTKEGQDWLWKTVSDAVHEDIDTFASGLDEAPAEEGKDFNIGLRLKMLMEELAPLYHKDFKGNAIWKSASAMAEARGELLKRAQALRSAQRLYETAQLSYAEAVFELYETFLSGAFLRPYSGDISRDPVLWFHPAETILEQAKANGWEVTLSALQYYVKQGLIPKPIRVGLRGKALYGPTTLPRLGLILKCSKEGMTLAEIKKVMPESLKATLEANPKRPEVKGLLRLARAK